MGTQALPLEPVLAEDAKVYERQAVEKWLKEHHRSPSTNLPMGSRLVAATQVKNMIERMATSGALPDEMMGEWTARIREKELVEQTQMKANAGDAEAMFTLGDWYFR